MSIAVDKAVPVPVRRGGDPKYPFAGMAHGDSFAVDMSEADKANPNAAKQRLRNAGVAFAKRKGLEASWIVREVVEDGERRVRIWLQINEGNA